MLSTDKILSYLAKILAVALVLSFHEFAHAYAAVRNGDITPKIYRRYTLNPLAHFDIIGLMMFVFVGFGWAKPVPINPSNFRKYKKGLFQVSVAGVVTNYCLAFIICPLFILSYGLPDMLLFDELIQMFLYYCFWFNIISFVFNLLPFYPLDGFRVMEALNRKRGKIFTFLRNYSYYILLGLIIAGYLLDLMNLSQYDYFSIALNYLMYIFSIPLTAFWGLII